jgi:hypothetical protein
MGLAERRAIKAFQDTNYPELEQQVHAAAGTPIPLEVDWNSLAFEGYGDSYAECLPRLFFVPLIQGFEKVAFDDMGKEAVRDGITKIVIKGSTEYSSWWAELEDKVLTLTYSFTNVDAVSDRVDVLVQKLESKL